MMMILAQLFINTINLHLQVKPAPHQAAGLSFILMVAAQRMAEKEPGLVLVFIGALKMSGRFGQI